MQVDTSLRSGHSVTAEECVFNMSHSTGSLSPRGKIKLAITSQAAIFFASVRVEPLSFFIEDCSEFRVKWLKNDKHKPQPKVLLTAVALTFWKRTLFCFTQNVFPKIVFLSIWSSCAELFEHARLVQSDMGMFAQHFIHAWDQLPVYHQNVAKHPGPAPPVALICLLLFLSLSAASD